MNSEINTFDYSPEMQPWFENLNRVWIEKYFSIEPQDNIVLGNPEETFLRDGGTILFVSLNNTIAGTVALKNEGDGIFELAKMGVDEKFQGKGLGASLINAAIRKANTLGAEKLVLYSNTKLEPAIHLYRKFGFKKVVLEPGRLARCNIKMELLLKPIIVVKAGLEQVPSIAAIGSESFRDAFTGFFNKKEDLDQYIHQTYNVGKISSSLAKPNSVFLLAHYYDEPAGFVKIKKQSFNKHISGSNQTEFQKIYVLKKFHGTGVATSLLEKAFNVVKECGSDHVWLDVIIENTRAIRFYQKNGFTRCGDHSFLIGSQTFIYDVMSLPVIQISKTHHTMSESM